MADVFKVTAAHPHDDWRLCRINRKRHQSRTHHPSRAQCARRHSPKAESTPCRRHLAGWCPCGQCDAAARWDVLLPLPRDHLCNGIPPYNGRTAPIRCDRRRRHNHRQHRSCLRHCERHLHLRAALGLRENNSLCDHAPRPP